MTDYFFSKEFGDYAYLTTTERDGEFITVFNIVKKGTYTKRSPTAKIIEISKTWEIAMEKHKEVALKCRT